MIVTLQFDVVAPDAELALENLTYVVLEKEIVLPMAPFPDMEISLSSLVLETDQRLETIEQLVKLIPYPTSLFTVRKVSCTLGEFPAINVYAETIAVSTLEEFKAVIQYYQWMYGFYDRFPPSE